MRSRCLYCTPAFLVVLSTVNTSFLLFSFITVDRAFKMAAIQVLFNSTSLYVTTLTDLKRWIVIACTKQYIQIIYQVYQSACNIKFIKSANLKYGIYKP